MDYSGWITAVASLLEYPLADASSVTPTGETAFDSIIPNAIDYTENRLQRDLDFIQTTVTSVTGTLTPNQRLQTLPSVDIPAVNQIPALLGAPIPANSILTTTNTSDLVKVTWPGYTVTQGQSVSILNPIPVGGLTLGGVYTIVSTLDADNFNIIANSAATSSASAIIVGSGLYVVCQQLRLVVGGIRGLPLEWVSRAYLDFSWPSETALTDPSGNPVLPMQATMNDQTSVLLGPAPGTGYALEVVGTMRIPQLSATNYTNFLTQQFPDLYLAASMVFWSGFQQNYGAQSDNPQQAVSWESQYQTLLKSATVEEVRKQFNDMSPSPSKPTGLTGQGG